MSDTKNYPIIERCPSHRLVERLVAQQYLRQKCAGVYSVFMGSDETGIPDCFAFIEEKLDIAIEVTAYKLTNVHDIRRVSELSPHLYSIDVKQSSEVHSIQPHPSTLIFKKLRGERTYERFDARKLVLLIYSDVIVKNGELSFAMLGPMNMSPSCDNFSHHRDIIIPDIEREANKVNGGQWDEIWLIDYTINLVPDNAEYHGIFIKGNL
jgi:hypothetical protein